MESSYPFETSRGAERCPAHIPTNLIAEALVQLLITSPLGTKDLQILPAVLFGVEPRSLCHDGVLSSQRSVQAADQRGDAGAIATTGH